MFADATIPDKAVDPGAWATLVERIGVGGFFALMFFLLFSAGFLLALKWTLGSRGFIRLGVLELFGAGKALVEDLRAGLKEMKAQGISQAAVCQREVVSSEQLRSAGVHFAEMGRALGRRVGADVDQQADAIVRSLAVPPAA